MNWIVIIVITVCGEATMAALSSWFDPSGGGARAVPQGPQLRYVNASGTYLAATGVRNPATGKFEYSFTPVPLGTLAVPDWGNTYHGWHSFSPYDEKHLVPMHLSPSATPPGNSYKLAVRIPVLAQGSEQILMFLCGGTILQSEMKTLHTMFEFSSEAAEGQLRIYALRASRQFTVTVPNPQGGMMTKPCTAPAWEPRDWMDRNEEIFGQRIVPPPRQQVGVAPAAPSLPQGAPPATNNGGAPVSPPANINTPEPAPTKVDLFQGKGRAPF